jgi:hypothetical protein
VGGECTQASDARELSQGLDLFQDKEYILQYIQA